MQIGRQMQNVSSTDRWSFRPEDWLKHDVESYMKRHKIENRTKGIHSFVRDKDNEIEKYKEALTSAKLECKPSTDFNVQCDFLNANNDCMKFWFSRGQIKKVTPIQCKHCWELQQKQKLTMESSSVSTKKPNYQTSRKTNKPKTYNRIKKILCEATGRWEEPTKIQVRCEKCKNGNRTLWADCQKRYLEQHI